MLHTPKLLIFRSLRCQQEKCGRTSASSSSSSRSQSSAASSSLSLSLARTVEHPMARTLGQRCRRRRHCRTRPVLACSDCCFILVNTRRSRCSLLASQSLSALAQQIQSLLLPPPLPSLLRKQKRYITLESMAFLLQSSYSLCFNPFQFCPPFVVYIVCSR